MDFGTADHALAQIIRGRFMRHFRSEGFDFDLYTERNVLSPPIVPIPDYDRNCASPGTN
jgi:hypothetical protein